MLSEVLARVSVRAADPKPERIQLHNVTLVPAKGARVIVADRVPAAAGAARSSVAAVSG